MHLVFRHEAEKEFLNLQAGNKSVNRTDQSNFSKKLESLGTDINSETSVTNACKKFITDEGIDIERSAEHFSNGWQLIEKEAFGRLINMFEAEDDETEFVAYLSLNERCSYNTQGEYFFLNIFSKEPNMVCVHELLHLFTHKNIKLSVGAKEFNDYKEALTVLINVEFNDLTEHEDRGYPQHQKLRKYIAEKYIKGSSVIKLTKQLFADDTFLKLLKYIG